MTVGRLPQIIYSPNSDTGTSTPGARLSFYEAGSTTVFKAVFSDFVGTPLTNPVIADGVGRFPNIVLDDGAGAYNVQFSTSDQATSPTYTQVWFQDNVGFAGDDPLLLGDGNAGAPSYSFASEPTTGHFLSGVGELSATVLGNEVGGWTAQGLNIITAGESATPSLIMEGDVDTGWRQNAANNWTFSSTGQDQLSLSLGALTLPGPTGATNVLSVGAKTGQTSVARMQGDDISQPITTLGEANSYYELGPISGTTGGSLLTGFSEDASTAMVLRGLIGSTAPGASVPALQVRSGKSNGTTGIQDLASTEVGFEWANSDGSTAFLQLLGGGDLLNVADNFVVGTTTGKGLSFPSAGAGVLDYYGSSTWTPVISDGTNNATMHASGTATYTRIGNLVTYQCYLIVTALNSVSGAVRVTGLPFVSTDSSSAHVGYGVQLAVSAGQSVGAYTQFGQSYINLNLWDATTGTTPLVSGELTNSTELMISGSYITSA